MTVAEILKGKTVSPEVSLAIAPGSRQVLAMLSANGALTALLDAGARILESACGPCIGMGQSPNSAGVSLRTFNRNFEGRSGTRDAGVYLVSPETAAVSCLTGYILSLIHIWLQLVPGDRRPAADIHHTRLYAEAGQCFHQQIRVVCQLLFHALFIRGLLLAEKAQRRISVALSLIHI